MFKWEGQAHIPPTRHWWIRARVKLIAKIIHASGLRRGDVLDFGTGTSAVPCLLSGEFPDFQFTGTDLAKPDQTDWPSNLSFSSNDEFQASSKMYDIIMMLDVLEHLEDPVAVVKELKVRLKPSGILIATVPALRILWSRYDELLGHKKRYDRSLLAKELEAAGFQIEDLRYYFASFLLPVLLFRRVKGKMTQGAEYTSDLQEVNRFTNGVYGFWSSADLFLFRRPPIGVSLYAIVRHRKER